MSSALSREILTRVTAFVCRVAFTYGTRRRVYAAQVKDTGRYLARARFMLASSRCILDGRVRAALCTRRRESLLLSSCKRETLSF